MSIFKWSTAGCEFWIFPEESFWMANEPGYDIVINEF